ncbi:MAG: transposase [Patescibacteria group bacterium]|nr:transposase [Patescibacteria group bacterium]
MPRKTREKIITNGALYHIVCRGVNQRCIFRAPQDYKKFLTILKKAKKMFGFYLYSYNLLPNHFHLYVEVGEVVVSKIMHYINSYYAGYFNRRYKRKGHLFQDRFYASLINTESYFWAVSAYIDLNALRAGLCKKLEDYLWSSFSVYFQKEYNDDLIDRNRFLEYSGEREIEGLRQDYIEFVKEESKNPPKPKFIKNERFI